MKLVNILREGGWGSWHMLGPFPLGGLLVFIHPCLVTLPGDRVFVPCVLSPPPAALCFSVWFLGQVNQGRVGSGQQGEVVACRLEWDGGWGRAAGHLEWW